MYIVEWRNKGIMLLSKNLSQRWGGMMSYGIPEYRLPRMIIAEEAKVILGFYKSDLKGVRLQILNLDLQKVIDGIQALGYAMGIETMVPSCVNFLVKVSSEQNTLK
jgi:hypothetical protein